MKNIDHKIQVLKENHKEVEGGITLREYTEMEKESDPGFLRWLLSNDDISDFGINMTSEQEAEYQDFLNTI